MNTEFGEKLQSAMSSIDSLTWRDKQGNIVKLVDASKEELQKWYNHCWEMLHNESLYNPGKIKIRKNIYLTWDACNTELFVRYLLHECNTELKTKKDILDYINSKRTTGDQDILNESIAILFSGLPPIFEKVTVNRLMDACFDKLDVLNKKMISDKFIWSQGIWLTEEEKAELTEIMPDGKIRNRMEVIKERLAGYVNADVKLRITPTGLTFAEFRSLVQLPPLPKISSLSTVALKTLRDKILLLLDNDLDYHINKWTTLINNIERVAEFKNYQLVTKN